MADLNKFEKMLELLVNENKEAAQELFHEIVVEKSRDIYESLLEDEDDVEEATDEEVDESDEDLDEADHDKDEDDDLDENFSLDSFEVEADDDTMGGDPTDDMMTDLGMDDGDDMDMDDEGGDMEDRVEDLEDALDDLKAEFEKMMAGDEGDDMDMDDEGDEEEKESFAFEADEEVDESDEEVDEAKKMKTKKTAGEEMREYVEKVSATMGDNGVNTKSTVASPNNMGGTTANIAKSGTESSPVEANKGNLKGSALSDQNPKDMNTKNVNVPGAKAATKMTAQPGHGAEKKGKPDTADKGATSILNKLNSRAK